MSVSSAVTGAPTAVPAAAWLCVPLVVDADGKAGGELASVRKVAVLVVAVPKLVSVDTATVWLVSLARPVTSWTALPPSVSAGEY